MLSSMMRRYLSILVIVSLVLAGISPACRFISGKTLYEICGFSEDKVVAPIDDALLAYLPDQPPEDDHESAKDDCVFCFAQSHLKLAKVPDAEVPVIMTGFEPLQPRAGPIFAAYDFLAYAPRGPPSHILS